MRSLANKIKKAALHYLVADESYQFSSLRQAPEMSAVIYEIKKAFEKGILPERVEESASSTFFLKDRDAKPIAIFKTERYVREYAAYRLDHKRFAHVPPTVITNLEHPFWEGKKTGSCQLFIEDAITAVHLSRDLYKKFSETSVRRMASLDIRLINADRHSSNILVRDETELIPIDHEFVLQNKMYVAGLSWIFWEQAATPFIEEELCYISSIDCEEDRKILIEELGFSEEIANRYYIATLFLKCGAFRKICPAVMGKWLKRKNFRDPNPTVFERTLFRLKKYESLSWTIFSIHVYEEVEKTIDEYAPSS